MRCLEDAGYAPASDACEAPVLLNELIPRMVSAERLELPPCLPCEGSTLPIGRSGHDMHMVPVERFELPP